MFNIPSMQFRLVEVGKTCGKVDLYHDGQGGGDAIQIESLLSELESEASSIFRKIVDAVAEDRDHVDILEENVHTLFKFMHLSMKRSAQRRNEINNTRGENDFLYQRLFEASMARGGSLDPRQFWIQDLLYLLETSHDQIPQDAEKIKGVSSAGTYKYFVDECALQIWKAADGHEFFLNERLVDFEGNTQSQLGIEVTEAGPQLICMTSDGMVHMILPLSPEVAVVFCNESRCCISPPTGIMQRGKIPHPDSSLLKDAPHKDVTTIAVEGQKRGRKRWPATTAWRVSISTLSADNHQALTS
ncbi:hypothetical protein PG988_003274 [Apiospora saccharicola]